MSKPKRWRYVLDEHAATIAQSCIKARLYKNGRRACLCTVQYMDYTEPTDKTDNVSGCFCLRCSILDAFDNFKVKEKNENVVRIGQWLGIKLFSSIAGRSSVLRGNNPIKPVIYAIHWAQQRFF